jgi:hypothetical protein
MSHYTCLAKALHYLAKAFAEQKQLPLVSHNYAFVVWAPSHNADNDNDDGGNGDDNDNDEDGSDNNNNEDGSV